MNSQLFFFLNLVAGLFFVWWFLSGRKGRGTKGTRLNMRPGESQQRPPPASPSSLSPSPTLSPSLSAKPASPPAPPPPPGLFSGANPPSPSRTEAKVLTVRFVYNGHDWEAFEVLGLPAGAKLAAVTQRYQELLRTADRAQMEFYEAAYRAILKKV